MNTTLATFTVAFVVTLATVPLIRRFCRRMQLLDRPGPLKIHTRPIPRLGGVAIFLSVLAGVFVAIHTSAAAEWHFLAAAGMVWVVGLLDDLRGLHPVPRLLAQVAAAAILWSGGWYLPAFGHRLAGFLAVCLLVVLFVNSWNFLDGADGLAAGFTCVLGLSYVVLPRELLSVTGSTAALALVAACAAFLVFNAYPANIFFGDSGSTLLGFLAAFLALDYAKTDPATPHPLLFPFVVASVPLLDAVRIVIQRIVQRRSVFEGSRAHFYDHLFAKGYGSRKVAWISWVVGLICGAIGVVSIYFRASQAWSLIAIFFVAIWIASVVALPPRPGKRSVAEKQSFGLAINLDELGARTEIKRTQCTTNP